MKLFSYRYLPLNFYLGYSLFVVLCLFFSPFAYRDINYSVVFVFILVISFIFSLGFIAGARGDMSLRVSVVDRENGNILKYFLAYLVIGAIYKWAVILVSGVSINFSGMGDSYFHAYDGYERGQASIGLGYILTIAEQICSTVALLFLFSNISSLRRGGRVAFVFAIFSYLALNVVAVGKQKYLGDVVIFSFYSYMIYLARQRRVFSPKSLAFLGVAGLAVIALFVEILRQRYVAAGIGVFNIAEKSHPLISWDESSYVFSLLGYEYGFALGVFSGYFTNGLYGLYLSMTLPFEWCYMLGNSYSLARIAEVIMNDPGAIVECTYPYRVGREYGWGFDKWHSLFSWLASDIGFIGVLGATFVFSYFYGKIWVSAVSRKNSIAPPLFVFLSLGLIFCYANNQIMHGLSGVGVLFLLSFFCIFFPRLKV
ncbi:MAG: hypothetical protein KBT87_05600 [Gammaproteobacteria bacterium]|nr:hypothetical protein [Gammaproteobacteria bacterium]MBQ0774130.1 hypothetical protein [Gammaproteobacteria bacterium]